MHHVGHRRNTSCAAGFTMLEILLVVVVISIAVGVAMPSFMRSFRGHRLRTASRTVAMLSRYARSVSVIHEQSPSLRFNLDNGRITMVCSNTTVPQTTRTVRDVSLLWVELEGEERVEEGTCTVQFYKNGTCRPFSLMLRDRSGGSILMEVDALAGVETREDEE